MVSMAFSSLSFGYIMKTVEDSSIMEDSLDYGLT